MIFRAKYHPVETAADLPKFCGVCGRPMRDDSHDNGHDRATGRPIRSVAVRCPKGGFDSNHEAFVVAPAPGWAAPAPQAGR